MSNPYQEALGRTLIERTFRERIVLVGVTLAGQNDDDTEEGLDELSLLIDTAGADEAARLTQRRDTPDPAWYIGKGKVDELREVCLAIDADTVVFDNELTPAQQFNLETALGRTALDRTAVILDIFAQNARTPEGRAQVELALLRYRMPRLRRGAKAGLSQQVGRIGTRGPGETRLEVDRRRIGERITRLERELADLGRTRTLQRKSRSKSGLTSVVIVGYTNAGKSTLLNALTSAGVLSEDRLFATLDPTTRRLALPGGETVLRVKVEEGLGIAFADGGLDPDPVRLALPGGLGKRSVHGAADSDSGADLPPPPCPTNRQASSGEDRWKASAICCRDTSGSWRTPAPFSMKSNVP